MAAEIRRLKTRSQASQEEAAEQLILALETVATHAKGQMAELAREQSAALRRKQAAAAEHWTFVMISPAQFEAVNSWLVANAARPIVAMQLWGSLFPRLDMRTGEILVSRTELAQVVGTSPQEVSRIMSQLAEVGAIIRRREPANGPVRYFMNPKVGTHLPKGLREKAQAGAPELKLDPTPKRRELKRKLALVD
jgi:hypothetical protein